MALPDNPITRKETYLAKIAGQEVQIPDVPITREEAYLDEIAKEGMGTKVIANPDDVAEDVLHKVEIDGEIYSVPSGGGGGGSNDYLDLDNLPQVNGVELKGNKTTSDLGIKFEDLPDAPTIPNDLADLQDDSSHRLVTDTEKATWNGKSDFSGSYADLSNKPENANTFQGTIAEWNQLTTAEKKAYDHASIPDSLDGNVTFPASKVMMLDGASVEADLASAVPRTASGTTIAQLISALNQLSEEQKDKCCIKITSSPGSHLIRRITGEFYTGLIASANGAAVYVYEFVASNTTPIYGYIKINETSLHDLTITAWTLYYQGTPIS